MLLYQRHLFEIDVGIQNNKNFKNFLVTKLFSIIYKSNY